MITFLLIIIVIAASWGLLYFLEDEMLEIEFDLAIGKSRQIGSHLLLIAGTMAPLHQVAMHLVGCQLHQFISFLARFHVLQLLEDFESMAP